MAKRKDYPGSLDKRSGSFRIQLCVGGKVECLSVQTTDMRVAKQRARQTYAELKAEHKRAESGLPVGVRFSKLLSEFEAGLAGARQEIRGSATCNRSTPFASFLLTRSAIRAFMPCRLNT